MLYFSSAVTYIPVHRTNHPAPRPVDPSTAFCDPNLFVAPVHHNAEGVDFSLRESVDPKPRNEALVVAFRDPLPAHDSTVVVEPLIMSEIECSESSSSSVTLLLVLPLPDMILMVQ